MIWTAISYNSATEKIETEVFEAAIDKNTAYVEISNKTRKVVLSIIKGNHESGTYVPDLEVCITRTKYNEKF
jgi:hypothetical protein|tara:strand:- start:441 stop:656 length:216 start_codon:yes stop_codon:yes gene_type:complete